MLQLLSVVFWWGVTRSGTAPRQTCRWEHCETAFKFAALNTHISCQSCLVLSRSLLQLWVGSCHERSALQVSRHALAHDNMNDTVNAACAACGCVTGPG